MIFACASTKNKSLAILFAFLLVHIVIIYFQALEERLKKDNPYKQQNSFMVFFDGQNDISLEGVEAGTMVDGWEIRPLNPTKVQWQIRALKICILEYIGT